jgi:DNA-binding transcriptional LysR family regulator
LPGVVRSHQIAVKDYRLNYLVVAANEGSMRAAADYLGIAPSSISRQIAQLERDLKIDLVEKGGHKMRLTAAGVALVEYYSSRIQSHETLMRRLSELRQGRANTVRIAIGDGLLLSPFTQALQAVFARHDDTTIDLLTTNSHEVQQLVADDVAQIGLVLKTSSDVRLRVHATIPQPIRLIMPTEHPLVAQVRVSLEQVADQRLVLPSGGLHLAEIIQSTFRDNGLPLNPVVTSNRIQPIIDAVRAGLGIALLPEILLWDLIHVGTLVTRPVDCPDFDETKVHLLTRLGQRLPPAGLSVLTALSAAIAQLENA